MKTNRLISQELAANLDLPSRISLEKQITDAKAQEGIAQSIPRDRKFHDYRNRSPGLAHLFGLLGPLGGRTVLDLGCGYLPTAVYFAQAGARRVYACDVSRKAVACVREMAEAAGVRERVSFLVCAGEQLPFAAETMDVVHGEGVLHHLRLPLAGAEIARVLKRGGKGAFKDPLGHNPFLELARDYLPRRDRKPTKGTDRPLKLSDIAKFGRNFKIVAYRGFELFSMILLLFGARGASKLVKQVRILEEYILGCFPILRRFCRFVVTGVEK